jgi:hypothetical protein
VSLNDRFLTWLGRRSWVVTAVLFLMLAANVGAVIHAEVSKRRALAGGVVKVRCVCEAP